MSHYEEHALLLGAQPRMVGVLARGGGQVSERRRVAVLLLGAGLVHHVGPNRLMVALARRLAGRGFVSLRFDHRGIGDSSPRIDGKPFEACAVEEAREAMDFLAATEGFEAFVLLGICSGAETALGAALEDRRVVGVGMINGGGQGAGGAWDTYEYSRLQVRHYLTNAMLSIDAWRRALTGRIQYRRLVAALMLRVRNLRGAPEEVAAAAREMARNIEGLAARGVRLLWLHSEKDFSRDYFDTMFPQGIDDLLRTGHVELECLRFVDHTMTPRHGQERFLARVQGWVDGFEGAQATTPDGSQAVAR
jgi:pimeloyl-ACP methyl ester carboxylesterase